MSDDETGKAPAPSTPLPEARPGEAPGGGPARDDGAPWRNFHGRRHGKTLRKGQVEHLETTLGEVEVPGVSWADNPARAQIDLAALFGGALPRQLRLEIGFGGGEHMLGVAAENRDIGVIGCEPFINGVAMLLAHMARQDITNVRVHPGDARDLMDVLPPASMDMAYVLYPDPWPKTRHHKRRFINPEQLDQLATVLKPGAELRVASDIPDYIRHSLAAVFDHPEFEWTGQRPADWHEPWDGWVRTRYEAKAIREGRTPCYLRFRRK